MPERNAEGTAWQETVAKDVNQGKRLSGPQAEPSQETIETNTTTENNPVMPEVDVMPRHLSLNVSRTSKGRMVGAHWFEPRIQTRGLGDRQYSEHEVTPEMSPVAAMSAKFMASARSSPAGFLTPRLSTPRERTPRTPGSTTSPRRGSQAGTRRQSQYSQYSQDDAASPGNRSIISEMPTPMSISVGRDRSLVGDTLGIRAYSESQQSAVQHGAAGFARTASVGERSYGAEPLTAAELNTRRGKQMSGIPDDDAALDEYFKNMAYTTARAQGYLDAHPKRNSARTAHTVRGYSWTAPREADQTSGVPSTIVARAVEVSRSLEGQRGTTEHKSDFQAFKHKVHQHHLWLSESMKTNKFGVLVLYDAAVAGAEKAGQSILLHLFHFYCGRQGIMGNDVTFDRITNSHVTMVMAEFIKMIRELVPCAQITTQELTWIIHRTKMLAVPVAWRKEWGQPPADTTGYKLTFPEFLCALIRVAVLCFPGDLAAPALTFHMDAVKNLAVELELERGLLNLKEKLSAIGRSSGGFSGWVDSTFSGPRPSDQIPAWGRRKEESAGAALEALDHDEDLMGRLVDALLRLGHSVGDTPWMTFEGSFLAMVVPRTGSALDGKDPTASDGLPPHKFMVSVRNNGERNQKFFVRLENLPMFTQVKKPRQNCFDDYAPDQNAAAPGHSIAFLLYAFTDKVGIVQGEIVISSTDGGPALYSVPVFLRVVKAAPLKQEEMRPQTTPRLTLSRHIKENVFALSPPAANFTLDEPPLQTAFCSLSIPDAPAVRGLTPVRDRPSRTKDHPLQLTPREPPTSTASDYSALEASSIPSPSKRKLRVPTLDLSKASVLNTARAQLQTGSALTERPTRTAGTRLSTADAAHRPKTTRVDVSGGSKLSRQGAANHPHTPFYLTHGRCSSGYFPMAVTQRPRLHIDLLSGGVLRTVNLHERFI